MPASLSEDPNYQQLMRALGMQTAGAESTRDLAITRATNQLGIDQAQIGLDERGLGISQQRNELARERNVISQNELGIDRAGLGVDYREVGLNRQNLASDRAGLGVDRSALGRRRAELGFESGITRRGIRQDRESAGLLNSSYTRQLLREQRQRQGFGAQELDEGGQRIGIASGRLDTQGRRLDLDTERLGLSGQRMDQARRRLDIEGTETVLAGNQLGIERDRIGQRYGAAALQYGYGVEDATTRFSQFGADQAVRTAEQALASAGDLYLQELLRNQ